jgi:hypothetical protein
VIPRAGQADGSGRLRLWSVLIAVALAGCAQQPKPMYHWEGYQRQVYEYFKGDGTTPADQLKMMLAQAEKARALSGLLPPGFRGHLGLLYLQAGQVDEARQMLEAEKVAFPESEAYMNFLLKGMKVPKT